jgi:ribonucleotide reductase alpha subunit
MYKPYPSWMSEEAKQTLSKGYLQGSETPLDMWKRVAKATSEYLNMPEIYADLLECLYEGYIGLATPVAANFGRSETNGLPVSCYANHVSDSLYSIYSHLKESAALSKYGGGTATFFGDIRHAGSPISGGGVSTGVAPWARQYDLAASLVTQGNTRRGNTALYLPIDHPDLLELLRAKDHTKGDPRKFIDSNIAVTITDRWINSMLGTPTSEPDPEKKKIFDEVLKIRMSSGSPYLVFIDNANKQNPDCYKQRDLSVKTSNLCCLSGETLVLTKQGPKPISSLVGQEVEIYDGSTWVKNSGFELVDSSAEVYEIILNTGIIIKATHNHRWFVGKYSYKEKYTSELEPGDYLEPFTCSVAPYPSLGSISVVSVKKLSQQEPVYCTNVPSTSKFALSCGVMTGNSEIFLHTDEDHTFVCVLSSLNLLKYPEWVNYRGKHTGLSVPEICVYLLDAVVEEFIIKASKLASMGRSVRFAKKSRAIGVGSMGLAALYQRFNIPFESEKAREINIQIHAFIKEKVDQASKNLATIFGEPEWCKGSGFRNTHRTAVAPTRSNSVICGAISQGIEPIDSNYFVAKQAKGTFVRKNPFLVDLLNSLKKNTPEIWKSILDNNGSVQHLHFLDEHSKQVFKTAREINQFELIRQAADRQAFICQGQSLNLFVHPYSTVEYLYKLHLSAWKLGLKSLYYLRSKSALLQDNSQSEALIITKWDCPYCSKAKNLLKTKEIPYKEMSVDEAKRLGIWQKTLTTVPQIWYNNKYIGGYQELLSMFQPTEMYQSNECESCHG